MKNAKLTKFEWAVLKATTQIPIGQTRSYAWVAKKIGKPKAMRAVGQALNKNPFPLIIPCHRVIRKNGLTGGFAKGSATKVDLLNMEKNIVKAFSSK
ncbi:MAG: MGMT family protein [Candidatus Omnitrophota bacterium]